MGSLQQNELQTSELYRFDLINSIHVIKKVIKKEQEVV